jgi:UDP-glucose 4-epimerase
MTTCLIFGGNGFIGSHLAEGLARNGFNVKIFDSFARGTTNIASIQDTIELIRGDFFSENDIQCALKGVDYIFHYISTTNPASSIKDPVFDIQSNVIGSIKMLQLAQKADVKKIFFSSSGGTIYGEPTSVPITECAPTNPVNPYAISKLVIEKYLEYFHHTYGMDYVILRYSNPYGERQNPLGNQGVIPIFLNKIKINEDPIIFGDGFSVRDYIYIQDAIDATLAVIKGYSKNSVYNIGEGKGTSLNELIQIMRDITGKEIKPKYLPDSGKYISKIVLDIEKIRKETGWFPKTDIHEGIQRTWEWILKSSDFNNY